MNMISKFIRQWKAFRLSLRLLKLIDPKKLEDLNVILEEIYPGIRAEIQALVESSDIHAMSKTLHYINTHGGVQKMADYYNNADKNGKDTMLSAFNKVFKPGARFEDAVMTLDSIAKQKDLGIYTQLIGDVKDSIVVTSIKQSYRTVDDWRTFVRWQHEANKDVLLGVLDEIEEKEAKVENKNTEEKVTNEKENNSEQPNNQSSEGVEYTFPMELLGKLYKYDNVVFKHIKSEFNFACIIMRKPHEERLSECSGHPKNNLLTQTDKNLRAARADPNSFEVCRVAREIQQMLNLGYPWIFGEIVVSLQRPHDPRRSPGGIRFVSASREARRMI